jgi:hypothetical protein
MGLLPSDETIEALDLDTLRRVADHVARSGIARTALAELAVCGEGEVERLGAILDDLDEALLLSPVPEHEWPALRRVLGDGQLAALVGISPSSLQRYSSGKRKTPDDVAARLHFLALVVGDLAGTYNELGTRRWFERKRVRLGSRSPAEILVGSWSPDDPGPREVFSLAESLLSSPAT